MVFAKSFIFKSNDSSYNNLTIDEKFDLLRKENDQFFLIVVSLFIFFMQAGFAFLEAGSVREGFFLLIITVSQTHLEMDKHCSSNIPYNGLDRRYLWAE